MFSSRGDERCRRSLGEFALISHCHTGEAVRQCSLLRDMQCLPLLLGELHPSNLRHCQLIAGNEIVVRVTLKDLGRAVRLGLAVSQQVRVQADATPVSSDDYDVKWTPTLITLKPDAKEHHRTYPCRLIGLNRRWPDSFLVEEPGSGGPAFFSYPSIDLRQTWSRA